MSEYWVSRKKYFCKYCDIYIADDVPSRQQHENGLRHKGNKDRFIRGLYKAGEKKLKDAAEEKRDMALVEQAAHAAFAQDVGAGFAKPSAPVASTSAQPARKPVPKPSNPYTNYSTAESLGYVDPDAERLAAEAERRRSMGVAGNWEVVAAPLQPALPDGLQAYDSTLKREAEAPVDEEDSRQFKLRKKKVGTGLGEIYDPGIIPIKIKKKEEATEPQLDASTSSQVGAVDALTSPSEMLKWTALHWKRPGERVPEEEAGISIGTEPTNKDDTKQPEPPQGEELETATSALGSTEATKQEETPIKLEEKFSSSLTSTAELSGSLFRKRKVPANIGIKGNRRG